MSDAADIEVVVKKPQAYVSNYYENSYRIIEMPCKSSIGNYVYYSEEWVLRSVFREERWRHYSQEKNRFYSNGVLRSVVYNLGTTRTDEDRGWERNYYEHGWTEEGQTSVSHWIKEGRPAHHSNEYHKNGQIKCKKVYKADGEKDYIIVYWNGPPLPTTEDGAIKGIESKTFPIVRTVDSDSGTEKKSQPFELSVLENAVLRKEDITTL